MQKQPTWGRTNIDVKSRHLAKLAPFPVPCAMQHQQEREPDTRPKQRRPLRSVGELIVAWLLVLWGAFSTFLILTLPIGLSMIFYHFGIFFWLFLLQGASSLMTGLLTLTGRSHLATWLLSTAALCFVGLALVVMFSPPSQIGKDFLPIVFLALAALFFFLGRWLGRQEDSEA